ncbi:cytochrome P450 81Q32-like [Silene latifolia]|uniref:cytochrome P450 81Q32-like n=1 Tax=Silene latifolia TaxID=37657 RepID=UPI003D77C24C
MEISNCKGQEGHSMSSLAEIRDGKPVRIIGTQGTCEAIRVKVDASWRRDYKAAIGWVAYDSTGTEIIRRQQKMRAESALQAEAFGLRDVLLWAQQCGCLHLDISTDCLQLINQIAGIEKENHLIRQSLATALAATGSVIAVKDQQMVDMNALFYDFTYQVMVRMIVGKHDGSRWVSKNGNKFREVLEKMYEISGSIYTRDILPLVRNMRSEKRLRVIHEKSDEMLQELLEEERSRTTSSCCTISKDMSVVQVLLTMQTTHPTTYTDDILKGVILVLFLAGVDTSASTMEWIMTLLLNNPFALMKAQAEIHEQVGHDRIVEEADLRNLNYLRCIINETLRMYPTVPMLLPHESSKDCLVGRYHIPRGTMLLVNVWGIHNNPQLWDNPKKFMPERFEGIKENQAGYKFMPFGSGRRRCPGENLAMRVIGQLIGLLIQCFEWERTSEELINMEERVRLTMLKVKPLRAKFGPRLSMLNQISQI